MERKRESKRVINAGWGGLALPRLAVDPLQRCFESFESLGPVSVSPQGWGLS